MLQCGLRKRSGALGVVLGTSQYIVMLQGGRTMGLLNKVNNSFVWLDHAGRNVFADLDSLQDYLTWRNRFFLRCSQVFAVIPQGTFCLTIVARCFGYIDTGQFMLIYGLGFLFWKFLNTLQQVRRDSEAEWAYFNCLTGLVNPRVILFLRPFAADDYSRTKPVPCIAWQGMQLEMNPEVELERKIFLGVESRNSTSIEPSNRPISVALGKTCEKTGAGRILVPSNEWKSAVIALVLNSELIIVLLGNRPGLVWELEQIFGASREDRTIFIMPPRRAAIQPNERAAQKFDAEEHWHQIVTCFADKGIKGLPTYRDSGLLFMIARTRADECVIAQVEIPSKHQQVPFVLDHLRQTLHSLSMEA